MARNIAIGLLRPPHVFFYEIDCKKGNFRKEKKKLIESATRRFSDFSLYRTKHGYHLVAWKYSKRNWLYFSKHFPSDFCKHLSIRFGRREPQILRVSAKYSLKTGKETSFKPKLLYGNFFLVNIDKYRVIYYAK